MAEFFEVDIKFHDASRDVDAKMTVPTDLLAGDVGNLAAHVIRQVAAFLPGRKFRGAVHAMFGYEGGVVHGNTRMRAATFVDRASPFVLLLPKHPEDVRAMAETMGVHPTRGIQTQMGSLCVRMDRLEVELAGTREELADTRGRVATLERLTVPKVRRFVCEKSRDFLRLEGREVLERQYPEMVDAVRDLGKQAKKDVPGIDSWGVFLNSWGVAVPGWWAVLRDRLNLSDEILEAASGDYDLASIEIHNPPVDVVEQFLETVEDGDDKRIASAVVHQLRDFMIENRERRLAKWRKSVQAHARGDANAIV